MTEDIGSPRSGRRTLWAAIREVVLIVLGVLIALSLESVWQDRSERMIERELLASLRDEFTHNASALDRWLLLHERGAASAHAFLSYLEEVPEGREVAVPDSLIGELARTPTFDPDMNSLDAALGSGRISLIRSVAIQRVLANWSRLLLDAQEQEQRSVNQTYGELLPLLGSAVSRGPAMSWLASDDRRLMRGEADESRPTTSSSVVSSARLVNALWVRYRLEMSAVNELQILREGLREALTLLDGELH